MKNSIILLIGVIGILCSCSEVVVTDYSSDNFIIRNANGCFKDGFGKDISKTI